MAAFDRSYGDDPGYFKELISKINDEVDFVGYLVAKGYKSLKKSSGSQELIKDGDRLVLNIKRTPISYFNRNDSNDKGFFFKYVKHRNTNFYKAVEYGLKQIGRYQAPKTTVLQRQKKTAYTSLEDSYNIGDLKRDEYLKHGRGLEPATYYSQLFAGRLFNAVHKRHNNGLISNVAVPKYDVDGNIKNYILYNRPYLERSSGEIKKFKLVLNTHYQYLWVSNPNLESDSIVLSEMVFDAMAHYELHRKPAFYMSFSGQLDDKKLEEFHLWRDKVDIYREKPVEMAFDNDMTGHLYDLKLMASLINKKHGRELVAVEWKRPEALLVLGMGHVSLERQKWAKALKVFFSGQVPLGVMTVYRDKTILQMNLEKFRQGAFRAQWKRMIGLLGRSLGGTKLKVRRTAIAKDWNQELQFKKKRPVMVSQKELKEAMGYMDVFVQAKNQAANRKIKVKDIQKDTLYCVVDKRVGILIDKKDIVSMKGFKKKTKKNNKTIGQCQKTRIGALRDC